MDFAFSPRKMRQCAANWTISIFEVSAFRHSLSCTGVAETVSGKRETISGRTFCCITPSHCFLRCSRQTSHNFSAGYRPAPLGRKRRQPMLQCSLFSRGNHCTGLPTVEPTSPKKIYAALTVTDGCLMCKKSQ